MPRAVHCAHCTATLTLEARRVLWSLEYRAWLLLCQACALTLLQQENIHAPTA